MRRAPISLLVASLALTLLTPEAVCGAVTVDPVPMAELAARQGARAIFGKLGGSLRSPNPGDPPHLAPAGSRISRNELDHWVKGTESFVREKSGAEIIHSWVRDGALFLELAGGTYGIVLGGFLSPEISLGVEPPGAPRVELPFIENAGSADSSLRSASSMGLSADAHTCSGWPDSNAGQDSRLYVGDPFPHLGWGVCRAFVRRGFSINGTILYADLNFFIHRSIGDWRVGAWALEGGPHNEWHESTVTSNNQPQWEAFQSEMWVYSESNYWGALEITQIAHRWNTGMQENNGVLVAGITGFAGALLEISSREGTHPPFLYIEFQPSAADKTLTYPVGTSDEYRGFFGSWQRPMADLKSYLPETFGSVRYSSASFYVERPGRYTISSNHSFEGMLVLYEGGFHPGKPLSRAIRTGLASAPGFVEMEVDLAAGVIYVLVLTGIAPGDQGWGSNSIRGPGAARLSGCFVGDEPAVFDDGSVPSFGRFCAMITWQTPSGASGSARPVGFRSQDSALFWFFNDANWELQLKVLNGCAINGYYWVFFSATTNVEFRLTIGEPLFRSKTYFNRMGQTAHAVTDTQAFSCF